MTRREMLALMGSAALAKSLHAEKASFGRIDTHSHIFASVPALIDNMEKDDWRALTICIWEQFNDDPKFELDVTRGFKTLADLEKQCAKVARESRGRISWAGSIDARGFEDRHFTEKAIANVQGCFKDGAIAIKIWKIIGMKIRGKDGKFLMPDDKRLLPVYEAIQKADRTLIAHVAEPNGAWLPPGDAGNHEGSYYNDHPVWRALPTDPAKETILEARDRILAHFPKLRVVGAHLGSNEEDLPALAKRLDKYPNFCVDMAARTARFFDGDLAMKRQFIEKYQDRLLYGSDHEGAEETDEELAKGLLAQENREWNLFASKDKITNRKKEVVGMGLPEPILRKLFHSNAVRMFPGIAPA